MMSGRTLTSVLCFFGRTLANALELLSAQGSLLRKLLAILAVSHIVHMKFNMP